MSIKILVVDDTRLNVKLLTEILEDEGYTVYSANNGTAALEIVHELMPDIILLDIMMPGIDGFEVCRLLKQDYDVKDIPVIMVTARTESSDIRKALELGAFDYIKKPVDEGEVIARVQSALRFKKYQEKLKEMAVKDGLTGLYNHTLLIELLDKELAKQERRKNDLCFVMIDIDYFKKVNDTYGHMTGDTILMELSNILISSVRKADIVGRYGGEEFGIVLPDIQCLDAVNLCERIRQNIEKHEFIVDGKILHVTVSIGIGYKSSETRIASNELIRIADQALYTVKRTGRNRIEVNYSPKDY